VLKGVLTDQGFDNAVGPADVRRPRLYRPNGMEQFVRDARIAMIYEGANGIQALDLVGRKLGAQRRPRRHRLLRRVSGFVKENEADEAMKPYVAPLGGLGHLQQATMWFMQNAHEEARQRRRRLLPTTCTSSASSRSATCGRGWPRPRWQAEQWRPRRRDAGALLTGKFFMERMMPETRGASGPHHGRRRHDDGDARRDVLICGEGAPGAASIHHNARPGPTPTARQ
jgi:acyl-CoA dehydrogenase